RANLDDWEGSTNDYLEIIKNDPQNTEVLANIADNYDYLKDYDKSIQYYTLALASDRVVKTDTSQRIRLSLGALMNDPDPDTDYEMEEIDLYFNRGVTHLKYEKWDEAVVDFNKTLELGAYPESSYLALGEAYLGKKDSINTCRVLIEAAKLGSNEARELLKENCI
ncbi:MAG: tetratricopeptide repeat protein, partial [Bacteroidota bacterium]